MSLLATRQDFEPATPEEYATALYWDSSGAGYECMAQTFNARIDGLKHRFAPNNQKFLIVGSGWGWLVDFAVTAGYDAYGIDASSYAIDKARSRYPTRASRMVLGDALTTAGMDAVATAAGLHGNPARWDLLITEDFLDVCTDAEITIALSLLRARCRANLAHLVTPSDAGGELDQRVNWKTIAQWKALLSPPDVVLGPDGVLL